MEQVAVMKKVQPIIILFLICISAGVFAHERVFYGIASYYGKKFHGRKTASGEIFNMHKFSAAHKTLPLGSVVKVTNISNNKSIIVKVNDRGPYVGSRVLDLSYAAAKKLDYIRKGLTRVKAKVIYLAPGKKKASRGGVPTPVNDEEKFTPPDNENGKSEKLKFMPVPGSQNKIRGGRILRIQIGAFKYKKNAEKRLAALREKGVDAEIVEVKSVSNFYYKVYSTTKFRQLNRAFEKLEKIRKKGIECFIIGQYYARSSE